MFKRFISIFSIFLFIITADCSVLQAKCKHCRHQQNKQLRNRSGYGFAYYPTKLEDVVKTIYAYPDARQLLERVNREGSVGLAISSSHGFQACWDSCSRMITVSPRQHRSKGSYITSIIFELHNAVSDKRLNQLTYLAEMGQMSKDSYVEGIERMEHENALKACALLNKGIRLNYLPRDAEWRIYRNFEDHYAVQQMTGHSDHIARSYDAMSRRRGRQPYKGTISEVRHYSEQDKMYYSRLLGIKNDLESLNRDEIARGTNDLQYEYEKLLSCFQDRTGKGCSRYDQRLKLMEKVFKGNPVYEMVIQKSPMITRQGGQKTKRSQT